MHNAAKIKMIIRKIVIMTGFIIFFMGLPKIAIPLFIDFTTKRYLTPFLFPRKISPAIEHTFTKFINRQERYTCPGGRCQGNAKKTKGFFFADLACFAVQKRILHGTWYRSKNRH
jgi:hypothetical protein